MGFGKFNTELFKYSNIFTHFQKIYMSITFLFYCKFITNDKTKFLLDKVFSETTKVVIFCG